MKKLIIVCSVVIASFLPQPPPRSNEVPLTIPHIPRLSTVSAEAFPVPSEVQEVVIASAPVTPVSVAPVSGSHEDWMAAAGISPNDYSYVDYIIGHESSWSFSAVNNLGATGLCQSLPGSKMASAGSDYLTNPVTQLKWCSSYAAGKGGWYASYLLWQSQAWW